MNPITPRSWIRRLFSRPSSPVRRTRRPALELLEDRVTPSTYTLSNLLDDGSAGSLRWAINQANSNPGPNTIVFPENLNTGVVLGVPFPFPAVLHLSSPLPTIRGDLTIDGNPIGDTVSGGGSVGIMTIAQNVNVHIDTLTLADGGSLSQSLGGAIVNFGTLTVTNCTFSNNAASDGGAIANDGQLTISGCTFLGCQAPNPGTAPTLAASAGGNFSAGGLYTYEYTWVTPAGETAASPPSVTSGVLTSQQVTVTIPALPAGVTQANIYRAGLQGPYQLVGSTSTTTFTDRGNGPIGGQPPTTNNAVHQAATDGGAIANLATLSVSASNFTGFLAGKGGVLYNAGGATISGSTLSNNQATWGGAVVNTTGLFPGSLLITNSTLSNNQALGANSAGVGGAFWIDSGSATLDHVTLSGNTARGSDGSVPGQFGAAGVGGALAIQGGSVTVTDSTITGNTAQGGAAAAGANAANAANGPDGVGPGAPGGTGGNGGAGGGGGAGGAGQGGGVWLSGGTLDLIRATVANNVATGGAGGAGGRGGSGGQGGTGSDGNVSAGGNGGNGGNGADGGAGGAGAEGAGGGLFMEGSSAILGQINSTVANNQVFGGNAGKGGNGGSGGNGGIGGTTTSVGAGGTGGNGGNGGNGGASGAAGGASGGGIEHDGGTLTVTNATVAWNQVQGGAAAGRSRGGFLGVWGDGGNDPNGNSGNPGSLGALGKDGALTPAQPVLGGGIGAETGNSSASLVTLANSLVALDTIGSTASDIAGAVDTVNSADNLIGTGGAGGLVGGSNGNQVGVANPGIGTLADNGGPTQTIALLPHSPALNAGNNALATDRLGNPLTTDQRGEPRIEVGTVDVGAYEYVPQESLVVTTLTDENNGTSDPTFGTGASLREAIAYANTLPGPATITFDPSVFSTPETITLTRGPLELANGSQITIDGGPAGLTLDGNGASGIVLVDSGATASLAHLTLTDGSAVDGGGIDNLGTLTVTACTLASNRAAFYGGGIINFGTMTMTNSTLAGNVAQRLGGGINNQGTLTVTDCTLGGNQAAFGGGGLYNAATITLINTIVAGSTGGDLFGSFAGSNDWIADGSGTGSGLTAPLSGDPMLDRSGLGNNGGPTQTIALLTGSPAIGAGVAVAGITTDQRGVLRASTPSIGAYEGPSLTLGTTSLNLGTTTFGTPGTPATYTVSGNALTGNVLVTPPAGVELSTDGTTWSSSLTLTPSNDTLVSTTIDIRISAGVSAGSLGGGLQNTGGGASEQDVTLSGTVNQAKPTVQVADAGGTYNGNAFPASDSVAGVVVGVDSTPASTLEGVTPTLTYYPGTYTLGTLPSSGGSSTAPSVAGSYTVVASFAGSTDYSSGQALANFSIAQASPTVSVSDAGGTYNGNAFPASDSVAGVVVGVDSTPASTLEGVTPTLTYYPGTYTLGTLPSSGGSSTAPSVAGSYTVVASFAGSTDYSSGQALANFSIAQASPTVFVSDTGGTYNGNALPASDSVAGVVAGVDSTPASTLEGVTPTLTYYSGTYTLGTLPSSGGSSTAPSVAGSYTVVASFAGSTDYSSGQALANFSIAQASPTVSVSDAGGTYNGNAFPVTDSVAGVVVGVDSTPASTLEGVTPTLTYYPGTYTLGTLPVSGGSSIAPSVAGSYTVVASFAGSTDYSSGQALANFSIAQASPTVSVSDAGGTYNGNAFPATDSVAGVVAGVDSTPASTLEGVTPTLTYYSGTYTLGTLPSSGGSSTAPSVAGSYTVVASFAGSTDYSSGQALANFSIAQASPTVSVSDTGGTYNQSPFPATATVAGVNGIARPNLENVAPALTYYAGSTASGTSLSGAPLLPGTYTVQASFAGSPDYTSASATTTFTITTPTTSITGPTIGVPGQPLTYTFAVNGPTQGIVFSVNYGDGTSLQTIAGGPSLKLDHLYTATGNFTIQVTATDTNHVVSQLATQAVTISTVAVEADPSGGTDLAVGGHAGGGDTITVSATNSTGKAVNVTVDKTALGTFTPTGHFLVYGQGGKDKITLSPFVVGHTSYYIQVPAFLYGEGRGGDTISAAGSAANNVLTGHGSNEVLTGGHGRDLLIAGTGAATLHAGVGDDILIGGWTNYDISSSGMTYDQKLAALDAIMAEWGSTDPYATRLNALASYLSPATVHDNYLKDRAVADQLLGNALANDWFFAGVNDHATGRTKNDVLTTIT